MQGTSRSELAAELESCARHCEETAAGYIDRHGEGAKTDVVSALLLAAAALDTAATALGEGGDTPPTALLIASTLVRDAIAAAERRGLDESLLHCVVDLRRIAALLEP
ncbi:MAG: hypothetical protein ABUS54_14820 [Actinomycetota bacterium]